MTHTWAARSWQHSQGIKFCLLPVENRDPGKRREQRNTSYWTGPMCVLVYAHMVFIKLEESGFIYFEIFVFHFTLPKAWQSIKNYWRTGSARRGTGRRFQEKEMRRGRAGSEQADQGVQLLQGKKESSCQQERRAEILPRHWACPRVRKAVSGLPGKKRGGAKPRTLGLPCCGEAMPHSAYRATREALQAWGGRERE